MEDSSTALEKMLAAENLFCLKQKLFIDFHRCQSIQGNRSLSDCPILWFLLRAHGTSSKEPSCGKNLQVGVESERDWCRVFVFQAPIGVCFYQFSSFVFSFHRQLCWRPNIISMIKKKKTC